MSFRKTKRCVCVSGLGIKFDFTTDNSVVVGMLNEFRRKRKKNQSKRRRTQTKII
jgi:hypothetical protein